ncbi:MAG: 3-dehydroquinate synthase [Balneolaceae bacterium]|nr:3-dehydroquinate synthase [Balneolaceae bacterium]
MSESIQVQTSTQDNYSIHISDNLSNEFAKCMQQYSSDKVFVIIDELVFEYHYSKLKPLLEAAFSHIHVYKVPRGESSKSTAVYNEIVNFVLEQGVERTTPLVAAGGGVTGDLAGFVAATVMRGIPLIHLPTTLLAMVDSSIGGKTGINHTTGKNLIGSFYQPDAVFADVRFLETLERKEWVNGLSEVLKYGMIDSPEIITEVGTILENGAFEEGNKWLPLIYKSAQIKVDIVKQDVLEAGSRAYLNFGHTFAHVIELEGGYQTYSHGEAVFAGMFGAIHSSNTLGANIDPANLKQFLSLYNLQLNSVSSDTKKLVQLMRRDKKVKDQQIKLVLLREMGTPFVYGVENPEMVEASWNYILNSFSS